MFFRRHKQTAVGSATLARALAVTSAIFATGIFASCSPYPIYNATTPPHTTQNGDSTGASARMERSRHEPSVAQDSRQPAAQATTIDERLFKRVVEGYLGVPYARGGSDSAGMDCSNLVSVLFRDYSGTSLPPSTRALWHLPREVAREELTVGDLVFFAYGSRTPSHVGVYMGGNRLVHASETEGVVMSSLDDADFRDAYKGARRVVSELRSEQ